MQPYPGRLSEKLPPLKNVWAGDLTGYRLLEGILIMIFTYPSPKRNCRKWRREQFYLLIDFGGEVEKNGGAQISSSPGPLGPEIKRALTGTGVAAPACMISAWRGGLPVPFAVWEKEVPATRILWPVII